MLKQWFKLLLGLSLNFTAVTHADPLTLTLSPGAQAVKWIQNDPLVVAVIKGVKKRYSFMAQGSPVPLRCRPLLSSSLQLIPSPVVEGTGYWDFNANIDCFTKTTSIENAMAVYIKLSGFIISSPKSTPKVTLTEVTFDFAGD